MLSPQSRDNNKIDNMATMRWAGGWQKAMKKRMLNVVAKGGIEPPPQAFLGLFGGK